MTGSRRDSGGVPRRLRARGAVSKSVLAGWVLLVLVAGLGGLVLADRSRRDWLLHELREAIPPTWRIALAAWRRDMQVDHDLAIAMPDGTTLTASLYRPRQAAGPLPTVLVRLPYHRLRYGEGITAGLFFAQHGYAVLVQDLRGSGDSGGELLPWRQAAEDGAATLDWIVAQPWSNGRVGTFGCSALGETQLVLSQVNHPAHRAMIASGAGGGVGSAAGRYGYFGVYEGGVFQLASAFGWFVDHGSKRPDAPPPRAFDRAAHLRELPVAGLVQRVRPVPNGYDDFVRTPLGDPRWDDWGYLDAGDRSRVPALVINTWGDQTTGDTLALAEQWRRAGVPQKVIIAAGTHCQHEETGTQTTRFGDLDLQHAERPWREWYLAWLDHWLKDQGDGLAALPAYTYFMLGENRWLQAESWPPQQATVQRWLLTSGGQANTRRGDGQLLPPGAPRPDRAADHDRFRYDPADPAPSRGGPVCCTGNPSDRAGPIDQAEVEQRADVLVYTSPPLQQPLRIAGPLKARLWVSSSARDTDLVLRLVHLRADGVALGLQEGALRLRYRDGVTRPRLLTPDEPVQVEVDLRSLAYSLPAGDRLRLQVTSSSFPRLERNLNTGAANNAEETRMVVAENRIHHGGPRASWIELPVLPDAP